MFRLVIYSTGEIKLEPYEQGSILRHVQYIQKRLQQSIQSVN